MRVWNKFGLSYHPGLRHSNAALLAAILYWLATVGITSSCLLLAFPLSVSLTSLHLGCLCFSVSILNS